MPGLSAGSSTTAPAPSANSTAVPRSFQSVMRESVSAPTTSARLASPQRTYLSAIDSAYMKPLQAVSTLKAGPPRQPSRPCSSTPQLGKHQVRRGRAEGDEVDLLGRHAGGIEGAARGLLRQIDRGLAVGGDVAALDARCASRIHSSVVSTIFSRSRLVRMRSGRCDPVPTMRE